MKLAERAAFSPWWTIILDYFRGLKQSNILVLLQPLSTHTGVAGSVQQSQLLIVIQDGLAHSNKLGAHTDHAFWMVPLDVVGSTCTSGEVHQDTQE
ncbi:hypothetical protein [Pseudomonas sp. NFX98]|uniref:hypothetical protein n=1 Tax=Pseudomonas sp. NFX98 TaxID=3399122 RepID=UPI0039FD6900